MTAETEGVVKYHLTFSKSAPVDVSLLDDLQFWRKKLYALKLIGQDDALYDGYSYGNLSQRLKPGLGEFIISGSQTSHLAETGPEHYAIVERTLIDENRLVASGPVKPSSEALTHSAFYQADKTINFIFHVHSSKIWTRAKELGIPVTSASVLYGTPEMAIEIKSMFDNGSLENRYVVSMGGHQDGIIAYGQTADEAGQSLLDLIAQIT